MNTPCPVKTAEIRAIVARIHAATQPAEFDSIALDLLGLESVDYDDEAGAQSVDDSRGILLDWVRQECTDSGIEFNAVGMKTE